MAEISFNFTNKIILITGASSGIGKQIAIECDKAGAKLILMGRNEERLTLLLASLKGQNHQIICGDLQDESFIENTCSALPAINGLIQSAGIMKLTPLKFIKSRDIDEMFSVNLRAPILFVTTLYKLKKLKPQSSIVLLSSITGTLIGARANAIYGVTKGGLQAFCKSASLELAKSKIRINCIAPGMIETEAVEKITEQVTAESIEMDKKTYPMSRYGHTSEVASAALFLLSDGSSWTTGSTVVIDGGITVQ